MAADHSEINHYAAGITLVLIGTFGIIGSVTGQLGNMLAALWDPGALAGAPTPKASAALSSLPNNILKTFLEPGFGLKNFLNSLP